MSLDSSKPIGRLYTISLMLNKENFEFEVEKTSKAIENYFEELIKKLEDSKKKYIEAFKLRAKGEMKDFLDEYDNFIAFYTNVKHKQEDITALEQLYDSSNDFDIVKESAFRQSDLMFKDFCPEYSTSLNELKEKYEQIEKKANYTFHFQTNTDDEEIVSNVHKNIKIKMKLEDLDDNSEENKSEGEGNEEVVETISKSKPKAETGHTGPLTFKSLYRIDKIKKKMHMFDFSNKQISTTTYSEPAPDDLQNKELDVRNMGKVQRGLLAPDSKSCWLDTGEIFAFGSSEVKFSDFLYYIDWTEIGECFKLEKKRKKISCVAHKNYIYFTGEFENININRSTLERYDAEKHVFEEIYGLNKQSNYILCIMNNRYLYAFPCSINSYKVLALDLDRLQECNEEEKKGCFKGEWLKYSPKNPNNINLYLSYKSCAIQISYNEIFISSLKYGYIYNTETHQFTGQYNFAIDDEFYDGFYLKDKVLYGFGTKGVHKFDLVLKKWTINHNKKSKSEMEEDESNKSETVEVHKYERGMSEDEDDNY